MRQSEQRDPAVDARVGPGRLRCHQKWPPAIAAATRDSSLPFVTLCLTLVNGGDKWRRVIGNAGLLSGPHAAVEAPGVTEKATEKRKGKEMTDLRDGQPAARDCLHSERWTNGKAEDAAVRHQGLIQFAAQQATCNSQVGHYSLTEVCAGVRDNTTGDRAPMASWPLSLSPGMHHCYFQRSPPSVALRSPRLVDADER